ncbi:protein XRI1-like isoform X1 [Zingiber officinale]|uniref:protein XRI1-like isoform X1 n=1 Tax=Zingiber officinale TaxID=94328 RepID=UPI001C4AFD94|nr:protein XRI1-like isoform X1 [Zingiber officinale]
MEFDDGNDAGNNCSGIWEWQGDEYSLQRDTRNELPHLFWDKINQNEDDLLYILDEHTPIKDCADLGHLLSDLGGDATKGWEECRDSMQLKRRRMLQFTSDARESPNDEMASALLKTKSTIMEDEIAESLECTAQWASAFSEERSGLNCEGLDQSSDGWLVDCLNESEMQCSPDEMNTIVAFNQQADISEYYQDSPTMETDTMPEITAPINLKVSKGKKSCIRSPRKLTTSVAYPFALIKPCGVHGDLTLSDINQRIHAPPPSKLKHVKDEDPFDLYPTSAFSGKPVVVKTKIRTEGGQGSITITRTKG